MNKYTCKYCNKDSKIQIAYADQMQIEGELYYIENYKCEHCKEITNNKHIKIT